MFEQTFSDTIYAISTGAGKAAVAIIRVSGPQVEKVLRKICHVQSFQDRRATLANLFDAEGQVLDRGLVIHFRGPHSYTGEDLVEFHVTGGRAVTVGLLTALSGCEKTRLADPGEFTRRAFEAGKLDLSEVEGLAAVVEAETRAQLRHARSMAAGSVRRQFDSVRNLLLNAAASLEAMLDFSDVEDAGDLTSEITLQFVREAHERLCELMRGSEVSERLRDGFIVVIAGPPNVGKSTLLNHLAGRDVAIVSHVAGTTRDVIEVRLDLAGYPVVLIDTAGIRDASDPVEQEGVRRAQERIERADLLMWLNDGNATSYPSSHDPTHTLRVRTKIDTGSQEYAAANELAISARTGQGIGNLVNHLVDLARTHFAGFEDAVVGTERQRQTARSTAESLLRIMNDPDRPPELIAEDLRQALESLSRISGRVGVEDVLGAIFSQLCVGK